MILAAAERQVLSARSTAAQQCQNYPREAVLWTRRLYRSVYPVRALMQGLNMRRHITMRTALGCRS